MYVLLACAVVVYLKAILLLNELIHLAQELKYLYASEGAKAVVTLFIVLLQHLCIIFKKKFCLFNDRMTDI